MRYDCILSDCPWRFENWSSAAKAVKGEKWGRAQGRPAYDCMDTEDIASLPVADLCHRDTLLFLWACGPKLEDAIQVMNGWGFQFITIPFTWTKLTPRALDNWKKWQQQGKTPEEIMAHLYHAGNGYYTMANAEFVLLGKRKGGKPKRVRKDVRSMVVAPVGRHSAKPPEVRQRIEALLGPDKRYLELFARPPVPAPWVGLGDEIDGLDIRDAIPLHLLELDSQRQLLAR